MADYITQKTIRQYCFMLLDLKKLNNLFNVLNECKNLVEEYYNKDDVTKKYSNVINIELHLDNDIIRRYNDFDEIIKDIGITDKNVIKFHYNLKRSFAQDFELVIDTKNNSIYSSFYFNNDELRNNIYHLISTWINDSKSNKFNYFISNNKYLLIFYMSLLMIFFASLCLEKNTSIDENKIIQKYSDYKKNNKNSIESVSKGIELILEMNYNENFRKENLHFNNKKYLLLIILPISTIIFLIFIPKSIIGLGKGIKKIKFYNIYFKIFFYFIPIYIFYPILINLVFK